jgi:HK97 family phage major capsid protein
MPYNSLIQRSDVAARIPSRISNIMLNSLRDSSAALTLGNRIPLPAGTNTFPVLSALPTAYWVNGDTGLKQTTTMAWAQKTITVEELAAIVPVPDNVFDDSDFDIWEEVRPALETAIAREIDKTVLLGLNKPASFPPGVAVGATTAPIANTVTIGTATAADGGITKDISDLFGKLEAEGYYPNKGVANAALRGVVRNMSLVPAQNVPGGASQVSTNDWFGADISYPMRGAWPAVATGAVEAIVGDFDQMVIGIRKDFTWKLLTEGVLTDNTNAIMFNLPQQDMTALRVTFRMGWQIANPINWDQPDPTKRYPFGVLKAA